MKTDKFIVLKKVLLNNIEQIRKRVFLWLYRFSNEPRNLLVVGLFIIGAAPYLAKWNFWGGTVDVESLTPIAEFFDGITAPFIGVMSIMLMYMALVSQIDANRELAKRQSALEIRETKRAYSFKASGRYDFLLHALNNFTYHESSNNEFVGIIGIQRYLRRYLYANPAFVPIYCSKDARILDIEHINFIGILDAYERLLLYINEDCMNEEDFDYYLNLTISNYDYYIGNGLNVNDLTTCSKCGVNHGRLPISIYFKLKNIVGLIESKAVT